MKEEFIATAIKRGWKHSKELTVYLGRKEAKRIAIEVLREVVEDCRNQISSLEKERDEILKKLDFEEKKASLTEEHGIIFPVCLERRTA